MAIFYKGNKLTNLAYKGQKIDTLYCHGRKIYSGWISPGTVLWSGNKAFYSGDNGYSISKDFKPISSTLHNSNLPLSKPISKLENGITINLSKSIVYSGGYSFEVTSLDRSDVSNSVKIDKSELQTGKWILYQQTSSNTYSVNVKMVNDTALQFESVDNEMAISENKIETETQSTELRNESQNTPEWLMIANITAY